MARSSRPIILVIHTSSTSIIFEELHARTIWSPRGVSSAGGDCKAPDRFHGSSRRMFNIDATSVIVARHAARDHRVSKHKRFRRRRRKPRILHSKILPLDFHFAHGTSWLQATFSSSHPFSRFIHLFGWKRSKCELTASPRSDNSIKKFSFSVKQKMAGSSLKRRGTELMQDWNGFIFKWAFSSRSPSSGTPNVHAISREILRSNYFILKSWRMNENLYYLYRIAFRVLLIRATQNLARER